MTREERDKREAEKRARMEGSPDIGGVTLPFSRSTLLKAFWAFAVVFPAWTLWNARAELTFETVFAGSVLYCVALFPSWMWTTGRVQGLPIFPIFALNFLPSYVTPLWQGHDLLKGYSFEQINTAAWTIAGFLLIAQLFWQQMAVRAVGVPQAVRMIDLKKAEGVLIWCLIAEIIFEVGTLFFQQLGGGGFAVIRGFAGAAGRMGLFVFSYRLGQGELSTFKRTLFVSIVVVLVIQESASLLLSSALPTLGIVFAGYLLGSGKVPWKVLSLTVVAISILHAGKFEMRAIYLDPEKPKTARLADYPAYFAEWVGYGLKNLAAGGVSKETDEKVSSASQRASLIHLMVQIQTMTPSQVPYLEGATYSFIPSLLIPRILSPGKAWAHTGNMILSLQYGILSGEAVFKTSVGFDPVMEAYANFGFIGVLVLAVVFGFFIGWTTRLTIHVPMLSFGFLFGVQVIACLIGGWNTTGVLVTTLWQSFLALLGLSFVLMDKQNNPVWKYYTIKLAEKLKFKKDPKLEKTLGEVKEILKAEDQSEDKGYGISDMGRQEGKAESENRKEETAPVMHQRPTRFVYGKKGK
jgi:hypothetical protein